MYKEVAKWLANVGMPVAEQYLRLHLTSHPRYPSLIAIEDTLNDLQIDVCSCEASAASVKQFGRPFLACLDNTEEAVYYFPDIHTAEATVSNFYIRWTGRVLLVSKQEEYGTAEHDQYLRQEKRNRFFTVVLLMGLQVMLAVVTIVSHSLSAIYFITGLAGIFISYQLLYKEDILKGQAISMQIRDKENSRPKLNNIASWLIRGDAGIVYFSASVLFLVVSLLLPGKINEQFYHLISVALACLPAYAVLYQWQSVMQWNMYAWLLSLVLMLNGAIGIRLMQWPVQWNQGLSAAGLIFAGLGVIGVAGWQVLKNMIQQNREVNNTTIKLMRLNRKAGVYSV